MFFAMWFATGIVMLFEPFPALSAADRFACLAPIELGTSRVTLPARVSRPADGISQLRLTSLNGRPTFHVHHADGVDSYTADGGATPIVVDPQQARTVAAGCGFGAPREVRTVSDDQWTVHQAFDPHRPLHKVALDDPSGMVVYVSSRTGEVVQKTTRSSRGWNWIGSVPHWIYPTVIRRHWRFWDALVWWLSGIGTAGTIAGIVIGLARVRQTPANAISPFRGALYWHHLSGLGLGLIVLAWILSGMLSMDHGRLFSSDSPTSEQVGVLAGDAPFEGDPAALGRRLTFPAPVREIEWLRVSGRRFLSFRGSPTAREVVAVDAEAGSAAAVLQSSLFADVQARLVPNARLVSSEVLARYDADYYGREHAPRPLPILRLRFDDPASTWLHVDLNTGRIIERVDASRRSYRYWFNALHSHDLPWMLEHSTLRYSWMVLLCACGLAFSLTGIWLAWKWLQRQTRSGAASPAGLGR